MVNPQSELYEQHPDWVHRATGYAPEVSRSQLVLNLAKAEVQDWIIDTIGQVLGSAYITWVKCADFCVHDSRSNT